MVLTDVLGMADPERNGDQVSATKVSDVHCEQASCYEACGNQDSDAKGVKSVAAEKQWFLPNTKADDDPCGRSVESYALGISGKGNRVTGNEEVCP